MALGLGGKMGAAAGASLLDMSKPLDIPLLDSTVNAFYGGSAEEVRLLRQAVKVQTICLLCSAPSLSITPAVHSCLFSC